MMRRDENTIFSLILQLAENDERIRAIILNGSRANPNAKKDPFQDFDVVYIVKDVAEFVDNPHWLKIFGEILIMEKPDDIDGRWPAHKDSFAFLMLLKDGNRIDLTLLRQDKISSRPLESQSIILLDKDNKFGTLPPPTDSDYLPKPITAKQFTDCCTEFLWISTYVAKGLARQQLTYAKYMSNLVQGELIKLLGWYAAIKTNFTQSIGYSGKNLQSLLEPEIWDAFKKTYVDADYQHMWDALLLMCQLFQKIAHQVAEHDGFTYNDKEHHDVVAYLTAIKNMPSV